MQYLLPTLFGLCFACAVSAQSSVPQEVIATMDSCAAIIDNKEQRLACFDNIVITNAAKNHEVRARENQLALNLADQPVSWRVRDFGTISAAGLADLGNKPGLFQLGRADGETISTVKIAALGIFQPINRPKRFLDTWEPFVGVAWERDTTVKTAKDQRQLMLGISGNLFNVGAGETAVISTTRIGYRNDLERKSKGNFFNLHADIVHLPWVTNDQTDATNTFIPIPYIGVLTQDNKSAILNPITDGRRTGVYVGLKSEFQLFRIVPRLAGTASIQWFRDASVSIGNDKQRHRFLDAGLTYYLVDPKIKRGWVPSLSLTRQSGIDPVTGEGPSHKTVLGLAIKFD